jgi:hypothetical protein
MPALTLEERALIVQRRTAKAIGAASELHNEVERARAILERSDLGLTGAQKQILLARYEALRQAASDALARVPLGSEIMTFVPDPDEMPQPIPL